MGYDLHDRLNWQQACTLLGISKAKFYRLVASGKLTGHRVGHRGLWVSREECLGLMGLLQAMTFSGKPASKP